MFKILAGIIANSEHPTSKEIAAKLGITVDGVKFCKYRISEIISEDYGWSIEKMADNGLITRWFLGL